MEIEKFKPDNTSLRYSNRFLDHPEYWVFFWKETSPDPIEGKTFLRSSYRILHASSVQEVITWSNDVAEGRDYAVMLACLQKDGYWDLHVLHGEYIDFYEVNDEPDFGWSLYESPQD
ncbi:hypothetical protein GP475_06830 [Corynebacterium poyangense]|uniref:Uncharacterized protein n=1 Tax=Corynebacterium poyangense TaxID=2684405 RepID=A0A7H0SPA6_9CORY|nr:hypothetical protein [Corynebacterium poyangense]MBZ8177956.1 hypothetical protein [Corynebacterium poyangense]QNQ90381.1 hypothetical protein GP475_06830 [Corynebacterium poyangense]